MSFVDAICVRFLSTSLVIHGKGNKLILQPGVQNEITTYDKIHQISFRRCDDGTFTVAASAGREILVTTVACQKFKETFKFMLTDWISSIKVLDDGLIAILTAHNIAALLEINDGHLAVKNRIRCEENSTLYCSLISGSSWDDLSFFGGTALGELIVWKKSEDASKILHRQFLHNGVIFSIDFRGNYLVTSSDDRSIKIFNAKHSGELFQLVEKKQLFGHTARVFASRIIQLNNEILFLSAGEDSNVCFWDESGDLLVKKNVSSSGGIWDLDFDCEFETVVTSSSTGILNKFALKEILHEQHYEENFDSRYTPSKLRYLANGVLVVLDSNMELHQKKGSKWQRIAQSTMKFVAMEVHQNRLLLAAKSSIAIFDYSEKSNSVVFTCRLDIEKILPSNLKLDYLRAIHALSHELVFVSDKAGLCLAIDVNLKKFTNCFQVPKSSEPWTTSVSKLHNLWLIADRVGNLFLFENSNQSTEPTTPIHKLERLHGLLGVTTIIAGGADGFVNTTGNDGTMKTLFIEESSNPATIEVHRCEKTALNWIEKVLEWDGKRFLLGFNDNYFAIYHHRQIIYEHRCGGRHRNWDVTYSEGRRKVELVYIKKKQLNFVEFNLSDFTFNSGDPKWHTNDCNTLVTFGSLLISGSEDTLLRVTAVDDSAKGPPVFHELAVVNSHVSSIKTFAILPEGKDILIFSAGGRAQIIITRLIKMKHVKEEVNYMLTNSGKNATTSKDSTFDPETRFTSICYDTISLNLYVACSDGFVRAFKLKREGRKPFEFSAITESFYGKCILRIHVIEQFVLTMATDGFVCFWHHDESSQRLTLIDKHKHNQSGINCFDVYKRDDGAFLIGTSGDDAGIFVTELMIESDRILFGKTISSYDVHTAQVTGLKFRDSGKFLVTASVDQTICLLEVMQSQSSLRVVDRKFTCISDVKGFAFLNDSKLVVYGAGMEVLPNFFIDKV